MQSEYSIRLQAVLYIHQQRPYIESPSRKESLSSHWLLNDQASSANKHIFVVSLLKFTAKLRWYAQKANSFV